MELPHPRISLAIFLVVENAIREAWDILRRQPCGDLDLLSAAEDPITEKLCEVLCDQVYSRGRVPGFDRQIFGKPTRESKVKNYNGKHLDKMPDLLLDLVDRPPVAIPHQDWLFIECKPVDSDHPAGSCYCDKGLIRFVNGGYAWAMQEAMMVGYTREGYTISPKLNDALHERSGTIRTLRFPSQCAKSRATRFSECVSITEHERAFPYVETGKQAPLITIRHLWLRRD
jgi:hypothetical protein